MAKSDAAATELVERWQTRLADRKNLKGLLDFLNKLSEPERRILAPLAIKTYQSAQKAADKAFMQALQVNQQQHHQEPVGEAISAIATCSLAELKGLSRRVWLTAEHNEKIKPHTVMAGRKPPWLAEWAEWMLATELHYWRMVQPLVDQKLIEPPKHFHYALALTGHHALGSYSMKSEYTVEQFFRDHPQLLTSIVYRLFEEPGQGEFSLASHDKYAHDSIHWATALRNLAKDGLLKRDQLLRASLEALHRDFPQFQAGWFSRFYEESEPTVDEVKAHVSLLVPLLGSKIPPTVAFAIKQLQRVVKSGSVAEPGKLLAALTGGLRATSKSTVATTLDLYTVLITQAPKERVSACIQVAEQLGHEKVDVQKMLVKFLMKHGDAGQPKLRAAIEPQLPALSATIRKELTTWLGAAPIESATVTIAPTAADWKTLTARMKQVKDPWRKLCGLTSLADGLPTALEFTSDDVPLDEADAIQPIATVEECIERIARWLETPTDGIEMECILDGLSRLGAERPAELAAWSGPLLARVKKLLPVPKDQWFSFQSVHLVANLVEVVYCWLMDEGLTLHFGEKYKSGGMPCERWEYHRGSTVYSVAHNPKTDLKAFHPLRLFHLINRLHRKVALPMLSMPTHRQGWIDAATLISRTKQWVDSGEELPVQEQVLALLRLKTGGKHNTKPLATLSHPFAQALRLALGDTVALPQTGEAAVWLAALLVAQPQAPLASLLKQVAHLHRFGMEHVDKLYRYGWQIFPRDDSVASVSREFRSLLAPYTWPLPESFDAQNWMTTLLLSGGNDEFFITREKAVDTGMFRWLPTTWPRGRQPWYAAELQRLVDNLDWSEAAWHDVVLLEPLLHPDEPLVGSTLLTLAFMLTAKEPGQQRLATDVLITGISDGRLDGPRLGEALGQVLRFSRTKSARLVRSLGDALQCGPLQQLVIVQALEQAMVAPMPTPLRDFSTLMEAWLEWATDAGMGITIPAARETLSTLKGGKLAKLAKQLMAVVHQPSPALLDAARYQAYQARVERAERWA